jgi:NAD(P)-dependent dehydrogenase (short-subunit alcohol dehydrogenase family)
MVDELFSLHGRIALVTGASSGLGEYFTQVLAEAGARVVGADIRKGVLETAMQQIRQKGFDVTALEMDVAGQDSVDQGFEKIAREIGIPDVIVNCAGVARAGDFIDTRIEDWELTMNVNLKGTYLVGRKAAALLVKNKKPGSIINVASLLGLGGVQPQLAFYQTSKTGVVALTRSMATELFRHGIRVNALCPGYVLTDMNREFFSSEEGQNYIRRMPQRRLGEKHELKGPLLLLASDAGSFINGAALPVDGGHSIRVI